MDCLVHLRWQPSDSSPHIFPAVMCLALLSHWFFRADPGCLTDNSRHVRLKGSLCWCPAKYIMEEWLGSKPHPVVLPVCVCVGVCVRACVCVCVCVCVCLWSQAKNREGLKLIMWKHYLWDWMKVCGHKRLCVNVIYNLIFSLLFHFVFITECCLPMDRESTLVFCLDVVLPSASAGWDGRGGHTLFVTRGAISKTKTVCVCVCVCVCGHWVSKSWDPLWSLQGSYPCGVQYQDVNDSAGRGCS